MGEKDGLRPLDLIGGRILSMDALEALPRITPNSCTQRSESPIWPLDLIAPNDGKGGDQDHLDLRQKFYIFQIFYPAAWDKPQKECAFL